MNIIYWAYLPKLYVLTLGVSLSLVEFICLRMLLYLPISQRVQAESDVGWYLPTGQLLHRVWAASVNWPLSQAVQLLVLYSVLIFPVSQLMHAACASGL